MGQKNHHHALSLFQLIKLPLIIGDGSHSKSYYFLRPLIMTFVLSKNGETIVRTLVSLNPIIGKNK